MGGEFFACVCVCVEKLSLSFPEAQSYNVTPTLWKPAVWQAGHQRPRNGPGTQILFALKLIQDGSEDSWLTMKMWATVVH